MVFTKDIREERRVKESKEEREKRQGEPCGVGAEQAGVVAKHQNGALEELTHVAIN